MTESEAHRRYLEASREWRVANEQLQLAQQRESSAALASDYAYADWLRIKTLDNAAV